MDTQSNSSLRFMMMDLQLFILVCEYMCIPLIQKETPQAAKFTDIWQLWWRQWRRWWGREDNNFQMSVKRYTDALLTFKHNVYHSQFIQCQQIIVPSTFNGCRTIWRHWRHFTGSITREDHMTSQHFHLYDFIFSCYKLLSICFSVASLVLLFLCLSCLFHKYENVCIKSCNLNCDTHFVYSIAWLLLWWDHSPWDYLHLWHKVTFGFIWHLFECGMSLQVSLLLYIQYGAIGVFWW